MTLPAPSLFGGDSGCPNGGQEGSKGRPGRAKRGPRASQERFFERLFRVFFLNVFVDFGMVSGPFLEPEIQEKHLNVRLFFIYFLV